jgi:hypothetical protein
MTSKKIQSKSEEADAINNLELSSIKALLAYTAYDKKVSEDIVRNVFSSRFGIDGVESLPRDAYDDAIRFLVDIEITTIH